MTFFIDNGDVGTNMPFTKESLPPRARRKGLLFWKQSLNSKTYYLESCTNTGRLITFQFFAMPPGITTTGLDPLSTSHFSNCGSKTRRQWALGSFCCVFFFWMNDAYDAWYVQMQMQKRLFLSSKGFLDKLETFANIFSKMTRLESCQDKSFWNAKRKEVGSTSLNL